MRDKANIIAAMNGPMAHIYFRSVASWNSTSPDINKLKLFAGLLKAYFMDGGIKLKKKDKDKFTKLLSSIDKILIRDNGAYKVFKGYNETPEDLTDNLGEAGADYVNAKLRIEGLNDINRSGDIVLIMKDQTVGTSDNRYTTGVACKSWHGSLNPSDSYVPMIVAYPGGNKKDLETLINNVCPTGCEGNWKVTDLIKKIIEKQYGIP